METNIVIYGLVGVSTFLVVILMVLGIFIFFVNRNKNAKVVKTVKKQKVKAEKIIKLKETIDYESKKHFDTGRHRRPFYTVVRWSNFFKDFFSKQKLVLINMELVNGKHRTFLVNPKKDGFLYLKKKYLFDDDAKYYVVDSALWAFDYHEQYCLPIQRKIPYNKIREAVETSGISEVEYASNPATLNQFIIAEISKGIMEGSSISDAIRFLKLVGVITLVSVVIHLLLFAQKTGVFDQITGVI